MKGKRAITIILATALVATLTIGTTLALLRAQTETVTNTFTSEKSIEISLREPKWDGYGFETDTTLPAGEAAESMTKISDTAYPRGAAAANDSPLYGVNIAKQYMPGDLIPKNPIVKNSSQDEKVYVAVTIECFDGKENAVSIAYGDKNTENSFVKKFGTLAFNNAWVKAGTVGNKMIYIYGTTEAPTELDVNAVTSAAVFQEVKLNDDIGEEEAVLPSFEVQVNAYAIQAKNIEVSDAGEKLLSFVKGE